VIPETLKQFSLKVSQYFLDSELVVVDAEEYERLRRLDTRMTMPIEACDRERRLRAQ